jgi:hypothetical protein
MNEKPLMPIWMRIALIATGVFNMFGTALFLPAFHSFRESNGLPAESHPLYLWIIASWIFLFGLCYLWLGITGRNERLFLVVGAAGKLAFVFLMFAYYAAGQIPLNAALGSLADLLFAILFIVWLWQMRQSRENW